MSIDLTLPPGVKVASHMPLRYTPEFWHPYKAYINYSPDIEGAYREGVALRQKHKLKTADELTELGVSNGIMITDLQGDFRDRGRLPVFGTDNAVLRTCVMAINGTVEDFYTLSMTSLDGHVPHHVSYASRWWDQNRKPFDLRQYKAAVLQLVDERRGIFQATCFGPNGRPVDMGPIQSMFNARDTVAYWHHLQKTGQGPIWVFAQHCKIGTDGTNLHPLLAETLSFMEGARMIDTIPVFKGHLRDTDWFGPFEPCRPDSSHPQGGFQKGIVEQFRGIKGKIHFVGVAEDFCNYHAERQVMRYFAGSSLINQLTFVTDCTAAIVSNAQHVQDLYAKAKAQGVKFTTHDLALAA